MTNGGSRDVMEEYFEANRRHWDEVVPVHLGGQFYRVAEFKAGESTLGTVEREELAGVRGKTFLHLQCHFGLDTLNWAREGAIVTGADFSEEAIAAARALSEETGVPGRFIVSDVYSLPQQLDERFDIVYTSHGALHWLPDLAAWAGVVARFLQPGGTLYAVEFHPVLGVFDWGPQLDELVVRNPYFNPGEPIRTDEQGTYADRDAVIENTTTYSWPHPLSEVVCALIDAGLRIEFLHEFPFSPEQHFAFMKRGPDRMYRLTRYDGSLPMLYSVKATKA